MEVTNKLHDVFGFRVTDGNSCIPTPEHGSHGASNDIAPTEHYRIRASDCDISVLE
jgi:hypothetical protein